MSTVTIIGIGNMARSVAVRALAGGYHVQLLGHSSEKAQQLAADLGSEAVTAGASGDLIDGDLVVLALWYDAAVPVVQQYGDALAGKTIVDITNPVDVSTFDGLVTPAGSSAAEEIAKGAPAGANVVKAFNTTLPGPWCPRRLPANRWTSWWPPMTPRPSKRYWHLSRPPGCVASTRVRCAVLASWRPWASYT
jgi:8-hydroxy-5-deazaflavin:NADPH oxidoreductase